MLSPQRPVQQKQSALLHAAGPARVPAAAPGAGEGPGAGGGCRGSSGGAAWRRGAQRVRRLHAGHEPGQRPAALHRVPPRRRRLGAHLGPRRLRRQRALRIRASRADAAARQGGARGQSAGTGAAAAASAADWSAGRRDAPTVSCAIVGVKCLNRDAVCGACGGPGRRVPGSCADASEPCNAARRHAAQRLMSARCA